MAGADETGSTGGGGAKAEAPFATKRGAVTNCTAQLTFDFVPVAGWLAPWIELVAQQLCSQPLLES